MKEEVCRIAYSFPIGIEFICGALTGILIMIVFLYAEKLQGIRRFFGWIVYWIVAKFK